MRVVLDVNVLISAFTARGACADLLERVEREHDLFLSREILDDFSRILCTKFKVPSDVAGRQRTRMRMAAELTHAPPLPRPVCRDPDDDHILAVCAHVCAEVLVTGDKDLLVLGRHGTTVILSPRAFFTYSPAGT